MVVSRSHGPRKESIQARCFLVAVFKPIQSMYGIFTYIWLAVMVNVGKCTIHAWYGFFLLQNLLISAAGIFWQGRFHVVEMPVCSPSHFVDLEPHAARFFFVQKLPERGMNLERGSSLFTHIRDS